MKKKNNERSFRKNKNDDNVKYNLNAVKQEKTENKVNVYLTNQKLYLNDKDFDLKNNDSIEELIKYCAANKISENNMKNINKLLENYFNGKLLKYNSLRRYFNYLPDMDSCFALDNSDMFEKIKFFNHLSELIGEKMKIDINDDKKIAEMLLKHKEEISEKQKKSDEMKKTKLNQLEDKIYKSQFEEFFEILEKSTDENKKDFFKRAGLDFNKDFKKNKNEFYEKFTLEEGTFILNNFIESHENFLLNSDQVHDIMQNKLNDYSEELKKNNKEIKQLLSQNSNIIDSRSDQSNKIFSMIDKSRDLYRKLHPLKAWFREFFGCYDSRTENLIKSLNNSLDMLQESVDVQQTRINEVLNSSIEEQINSINAKQENKKNQMSEFGIDINSIRASSDDELKSLKNHKNLSDNVLIISDVKPGNTASLGNKSIFNSFSKKFKKNKDLNEEYIGSIDSIDIGSRLGL